MTDRAAIHARQAAHVSPVFGGDVAFGLGVGQQAVVVAHQSAHSTVVAAADVTTCGDVADDSPVVTGQAAHGEGRSAIHLDPAERGGVGNGGFVRADQAAEMAVAGLAAVRDGPAGLHVV
ncbi:hypothetical protein D3C71_1467020 [compost metagenome]